MSGWKLPAVGEPWPDGRLRCCEEDGGGSHYHCANCGGVTGMYGHYATLTAGSDWCERFAARLGVDLPFEGFTCAIEQAGDAA